MDPKISLGGSSWPCYRFGSFWLDPSERRLEYDGVCIELTPKAFDTLLLLVENSGHLLDKDHFMRVLWPDSIVEETNLAHYISQLRKVLQEKLPDQQFIETVPKAGYRFVVPVEQIRPLESHASRRLSETHSEAAIAQEAIRRRSRFWWLVFMLLVASVTLLAYFHTVSKSIESAAEAQTIAVLPFKLVGVDTDAEYLGVGLADAVISRLSGVRAIQVRPTSQVKKYINEDNPAAIGRSLRVETVLDGTIRRAGSRLRVTVQLISARDGEAIWAESYDEEMTHLFAVEDAIAKRVAGSLVARLAPDERMALSEHGTDNLEAYQAFRKGRFFWNRFTEEGGRKSIEFYRQAIETDPQFARAYAALADSYTALGLYAISPREAFPQAKIFAEQALRLDGHLAEAHAALGAIKFYYDWDWEGAEQQIRAAAGLAPRYAEVYPCFLHFRAAMGQSQAAVVEIRNALSRDPASVYLNGELGCAHYYSNDFREAIAQSREALELDPQYVITLYNMGRASGQTGLYSEALAALEQARKIDPAPFLLAETGYVYARMGLREEAQETLVRLKELRERGERYVDAYPVAFISVGLGDNEDALHWLEEAYKDRSTWLPFLKAEPKFLPLRSDPRFQRLLRRVG
jgi:TolB-like protein/DNA-binding winged helix-turn-helix (wHTH) protein/Flp pilus assembly protein TadD